MNTHITAPRQFRLYGAVLAMAALLAVLLAVTMTAGPAMAQVDLGPGHLPLTGNNDDIYDDPVPCSEEAEPDEQTARVITDGYYPLFEGFWDYGVGHLSNNFCPPKVTETDDLGETTITREDANIHISETAFSVPTSYKVTVIDSRPDTVNGVPAPGTVTGPTIDIADYPFLALSGAVSAVKEEKDQSGNTTTVFANNTLWWVRLDEPDTPNVVEKSPLKIALSTALMSDSHWHLPDGDDPDTEPEPPVEFHFSAVHVLRAGTLQETHVVGANFFAFDQRETDTPLEKALWTDVKTDKNSEIDMELGQYRPLQFAFTQPGVYRMQVNVEGHVRKTKPTNADTGWRPISPDDTITSPVQWYTFHVGPEADLGVTLTHTDETADDDTTTVTDGTASFTVTATNNGPETAQDVVVEVSLPLGLSPPRGLPDGVTYECGVLSWKVGNLTATGTSSTKTLSLTATVDSGGSKSLTVDAEVHSSTVDDDERNDTASVEVKTNSTTVTPPFFMGVERGIVEHAIAGAHAGDPVAAKNPDGRALNYWLTGRCYDWFQVHSNGQIVLAANKTLDYDKQVSFNLVMHVSDRVNASGGTDTSADDSIPVTIKVLDTEAGTVHPTVTFKLTAANSDVAVTGDPVVGSSYWLRTTVNKAPEGATLTYDWFEEGFHNPLWANRFHTSYYPADGLTAGPKTYTVHIKWPGGGMTAQHTINWVAPPSE